MSVSEPQHWLEQAKQALHSAGKFAQQWRTNSDRICAGNWANTAITCAVKAHAASGQIAFSNDAGLLEMITIVKAKNEWYFEDRLIDEVILLHACKWGDLAICGDSQDAPQREMLLEVCEFANKLIEELS